MVAPSPMPTQRRQRRGVLAPVVGLVALGICGLVVLGLVGSTVGAGGVVVGALCALLPVGLVVATFLWIDRWEPEPPRLLLVAFLWGACFAALSALVINSSAALVADEVLGRGSGDVLGATVIAPVVEEAVKGAFIVGLLIFRRREFDGVVDGIVYAGLVAAGFAFTENILYIGRAFAEDGLAGQSGGVLAVLLLRGVLSPFAHPLFTAMTGIAAGIAVANRSVPVRFVAVLVGYLVAVVLHALWNGSAALGGGLFFLGVYAFVMVPIFLALVIVVILQRRREQRVVAEQLPGFAQAGWIAPSEVPLLSSLAGRRGWRAAVRQRSGRAAAKAVTEYQNAVTELAFLRMRMARGSVSASGPYWHDQMLTELFRARARAIGMPDALTAAWRRSPPPGWAPPPPGPPPAPPPGTAGPPHYPGAQHRGAPNPPNARPPDRCPAATNAAREPFPRAGEAGHAPSPPRRPPTNLCGRRHRWRRRSSGTCPTGPERGDVMSAGRPARLAVGVVSAGRVGAVLGAALSAAGHHVVATSGVSRDSVRRAAALLPERPAAAAGRGRVRIGPGAARRAGRRAPRSRARPGRRRLLPGRSDRRAHLRREWRRRAGTGDGPRRAPPRAAPGHDVHGPHRGRRPARGLLRRRDGHRGRRGRLERGRGARRGDGRRAGAGRRGGPPGLPRRAGVRREPPGHDRARLRGRAGARGRPPGRTPDRAAAVGRSGQLPSPR